MHKAIWLVGWLALFITSMLHAEPAPKRVLLLMSYDPLFPTSHLIVDSLRDTLERESPQPIELQVEYLYSKHNNNAEYLQKALSLLQLRRPLSSYDLIISSDDNALRLLHRYARPQLPDTPIIFMGVNDGDLIRNVRGSGGYTGQYEGIPAAEFMAWYRTLFFQQPLRVVVDGRPSGQADLKALEVASRSVGQSMVILSLQQLSWTELQHQLQRTHQPLLLLSGYRDRQGVDKSFQEALRFIQQSTPAPLLHIYAHGIGQGMVAGVVVDHHQHAQLAAKQALQVLSGSAINRIDVNWQTPKLTLADEPQFFQYGLNSRLMPADTQWLNSAQPQWQQLNQIVLLVAFVLLLVMLPLFWLWLRWQRSRMYGQQQRQQYQALQQTLDSLPDIVFIKDCDGHYRYCNDAAARFVGKPAEQIIGLHDSDVFSAELTEVLKQIDQDIVINRQARTMEEWIQDAQQRLALLQTTKTPLFNDRQEVEGVIGVARDITELRKTQQSLEHMAHHDSLTGLPNRSLLYQRLTYALQMAHRNQQQAAVVYIDLDRFKEINDTLGHAIGDLLLRDVAQRLHANVRESDICSRLGGDEFVVVLTQVDNPQHIPSKCQNLLHALAQPYSLQGHLLTVFASAGVSLFPQHGSQVDELLRHADKALNQAKLEGRNRYCLYDAREQDDQPQRAHLEQELRFAIEQKQLTLAYQAQFRIDQSQPQRVEALLRWPHHHHGPIAPNEFIPLAEATGLMAELGMWALEQACRDFLSWRRRGLLMQKLAVNISAIQIDGQFAKRVQNLLQGLHFEPQWLELEVTESLMMNTTSEVTTQIKALTAMGIDFAIDDFGTGYSSLGKLKNMLVSTLKIDQSFIAGLSGDGHDFELVQAIILLANSLNIQVVAEGVETAEQADILQRLGCEWLQGFYVGLPLDHDAFFHHYHSI